ncbi:MAG TPA: DUF1254 domain-containing protein [Bauldia sp.]|nr:DUF1254 domain-containing protein [Bauldia sp.]
MNTRAIDARLRGALFGAGAALATAAGVPALAASDGAPSPAEVEQIVEEAYIYGFPMIMGYGILYEYNVDTASPQYKAPFNQISNQARVYTYQDTAITTPNSDTPYSILQLDLRAEPIVLCMPEIDKNRYYSVQLVDQYTFNYGYIGSRTTGNGAGCYMVAGPDWQGEVPEGVAKAFRSETEFSLAVYRTQLFDPSDIDNVKKVQAGYKVEPLSAFLGQPAPPAAPAIEWLEPSADAIKGDFIKYLNFVLEFCPLTGPAEVEKAMRARFAEIGVGSDVKLDMSNPDIAQAFQNGIKNAAAKIEATASSVGTEVNGWRIGAAAGSREFYNGNWALRAAGAKLGIYGNDPEEATYPYTRNDGTGQPLDGSKSNYTLTFPADGLPPVNAFWSVTMYDGKTQFLIKNPIDRYLINSPMLDSLQKNEDGSLTITIQKDSPGKDKESNWLPAPDGPMFLVMRLYWPKTEPPSVFPLGSGTWSPPGIVTVKQ